MLRLEYFVVAESHSVDQITNRVSIFNVLEEVQSPTFPVVIPQLVAVALWHAEAEDIERDFQSTVRLRTPDGALRPFEQNFTMVGPRLRTIALVVGLEIKEPGIMEIELLLNGKHVASHIVAVAQTESQRPLGAVSS